jgi:hypothetical protein
MPRLRTRIALALSAALLAIAALWLATTGKEMFRIATGSVSRGLCDAAFVSRVDPDRVFREENAPMMRGIGWAIRYRVDRTRREVRASVLGGFAARAVFRPGLGCRVMHGDGPVPEAAGFTPAPIASPFPTDTVESSDPAIRQALDRAFAEPDPAHPRRTKAVVVLHDGRLIAAGAPADVLRPDLLTRAYGLDIDRLDRPGKTPVVFPNL